MPTLNVRLAAIMMVSALVLGGGVAALHAVQVGRQATALQAASKTAEEDHKAALAKAESATSKDDKIAAKTEADKDLSEAIRLLRDYVTLVRHDRGAELHLGRSTPKRDNFGRPATFWKRASDMRTNPTRR